MPSEHYFAFIPPPPKLGEEAAKQTEGYATNI